MAAMAISIPHSVQPNVVSALRSIEGVMVIFLSGIKCQIIDLPANARESWAGGQGACQCLSMPFHEEYSGCPR